jgi:hypothetical protein
MMCFDMMQASSTCTAIGCARIEMEGGPANLMGKETFGLCSTKKY